MKRLAATESRTRESAWGTSALTLSHDSWHQPPQSFICTAQVVYTECLSRTPDSHLSMCSQNSVRGWLENSLRQERTLLSVFLTVIAQSILPQAQHKLILWAENRAVNGYWHWIGGNKDTNWLLTQIGGTITDTEMDRWPGHVNATPLGQGCTQSLWTSLVQNVLWEASLNVFSG